MDEDGRLTWSAGDAEVTLRDVGANVNRLTADGVETLILAGQGPLTFRGVVELIFRDAGELEVVESNGTVDEPAEVCAALADQG